LALYWLCVYRLYKSSMIMMRSAPVATVPPCIRLWPFSRLVIMNTLLIFLCAPHSKEDSHLMDTYVYKSTSHCHTVKHRFYLEFFLDICSKGKKKHKTTSSLARVSFPRANPRLPINALVKTEILQSSWWGVRASPRGRHISDA
jgi:hypothetical protein